VKQSLTKKDLQIVAIKFHNFILWMLKIRFNWF